MNRLNNYFAYKDLVPETLHSIHDIRLCAESIHFLACVHREGVSPKIGKSAKRTHSFS